MSPVPGVPVRDPDFTGRSVVVTGGASGIGHECARRFAFAGAAVTILDIDAATAGRAVEGLAREGLSVAALGCDVSKADEVREAMAEIEARTGRLDVLYNNASVFAAADFLEADEALFDRTMSVNLKSVFLCSQAFGRIVRASGHGGAIVNAASVGVSYTTPDTVLYATAKGGVQSMTRAMALALGPHGIRVNAVAPGTVVTEMVRERFEDPVRRARALDRTPLGRLGEPGDVAGAVLFLASDNAAYVTGATLFIDGGRTGLY
ncbi:SDR family NAD(P)-dependent oxidoreductase [Acuticoccus mangrovi]|uniref:Glucose 1-dehydrogenase n=1 Tax=Acuticoccus mangrovi TaxID=2796142 RepID=A0A934MDV7_9HYPH|nr:glucose 1-dehydrogenase [Acuticoccus mangrovi]